MKNSGHARCAERSGGRYPSGSSKEYDPPQATQSGLQWNASQQIISTAAKTSSFCASDRCMPGNISSSQVQTLAQELNSHTLNIRTRPWRASTSSTGFLTVSIDNPTAITQPEPPSAWTLHAMTARLAISNVETSETKIPKGVPLKFDINSVGKPQTSMALNERFRIFKERRSQISKGKRFVIVD
ncbi:UAP56-interacting factor-like isoform X2 [Syngnathus typhle]|uniref:UAP56-interacting factor-like isoform X2 n=1 Tax=Syngnathus typhle TaxID=161592 RepID=UPI002A6A70DC|nr:UAP56-interacting factor-like isoform X2 [Syngnathus typhle]XP_061150942.1 UAP56-interacting factor-like isoform X2 [Syngnathus typhle]